MRLGRLILQVCAFLISAALVAGGYIYYRERQVEAFEQALHRPSASVDGLVSLLLNAPSAVCRNEASSFQGAAAAVMYVHDGRVYLRLTDITTRTVTEQVIDAAGMHVWGTGARNIVFASMDELRGFPSLSFGGEDYGGVVRSSDCEVWWSPDASVFRVPANLPILDYSDF